MVVLPSENCTTRLNEVNWTSVSTGKPGGHSFGPVMLVMSNWPKLPGIVTSHEMKPSAIGAACAAHQARLPTMARPAVIIRYFCRCDQSTLYFMEVFR